MCSPLGREAANAQPAMQALADQLAGAGVAALRFAYAGTGDSAGGLDDPERMSDWLASIDEAGRFARLATDGPVVLLGMRRARCWPSSRWAAARPSITWWRGTRAPPVATSSVWSARCWPPVTGPRRPGTDR